MNEKTLERIAIALEAISVGFDAAKPEALIIREVQRLAAFAIGRLRNEMSGKSGRQWVTMYEQSKLCIGHDDFEIQVSITHIGRR